MTALLGLFAAAGFVLGCLGVFSVVRYVSVQRLGEMSLRLALGASTTNVLRLLLMSGLGPAVLGTAVGALAAVGLTRAMASVIYGVSPNDFKTFLSGTILVWASALAAAYLPARRATKVDPVQVLRRE